MRTITIPAAPMPTYEAETGTEEEIRAAKGRNRLADLRYTEDLKERNRKVQALEQNIEAAYSLVWGQCTITMQSQVKTVATYATLRENFDLFGLLKEIKGHSFKLTDRDYP